MKLVHLLFTLGLIQGCSGPLEQRAAAPVDRGIGAKILVSAPVPRQIEPLASAGSLVPKGFSASAQYGGVGDREPTFTSDRISLGNTLGTPAQRSQR